MFFLINLGFFFGTAASMYFGPPSGGQLSAIGLIVVTGGLLEVVFGWMFKGEW